MITVAFLGNRLPHPTITMQSALKILSGTEPDLRVLRVLSARAFVDIETYTNRLELKVVEGRLIGYSNNGKSYRFYILTSRHIMEKTETSSSLRHRRAYSHHLWTHYCERAFNELSSGRTSRSDQ